MDHNSCTVCQLNRDTNPRLTRELELFPEIQGPFLRLGIDHVGPLPETERGNRYVLVVVDHFTHWVEALAVPDVTAETTARVLLSEVYCRYGIPTEILTDRGSAFVSQLFEEMQLLLGYRHRITTAYHPSSNGMVERFNRTLKGMIRSLVNGSTNMWDEYLHWCCFAYRTAEVDSTGYTPFMLVQGREPRSVLDSVRTNFDVLERPSEWARRMTHQISRVREIVSNRRVEDRRSLQQRRFGIPLPRYHVGDKVLVRRMGIPSGLGRSLHPKFEGPYVITKIVSKKVVEVNFGGRRKKDLINVERIKLFREDDNRERVNQYEVLREDSSDEDEDGEQKQMPEEDEDIVYDPGVEETKGDVSSDEPTYDDDDRKNTSPVLGMTFVPI